MSEEGIPCATGASTDPMAEEGTPTATGAATDPMAKGGKSSATEVSTDGGPLCMEVADEQSVISNHEPRMPAPLLRRRGRTMTNKRPLTTHPRVRRGRLKGQNPLVGERG